MTQPSFVSRVAQAFGCFFRVLGDPEFACRVRDAEAPALPPAAPQLRDPNAEPADSSGLELLGLLQREGRLVDFLMQDVTRHSDEDIGTAARHVHAGCRKALLGCAEIRSVRDEAEGSRLVLEAGFDPRSLRLTGNVPGKGPYTGTLVHRGWRALSLRLPKSTSGGDPNVLAQAEVEV